MTETETLVASLTKLAVEPVLLNASIAGTQEGLAMCGICPRAVGATCFFTPRNPMSIIVGLVGECSGTVTMNMTEAGVLHLTSKLMGEELERLDEDAIDGIMEIGNMVAGRVKDNLVGTEYEISHISLPSVIFGHGYHVLYSRGMKTCGVEFELEDLPFSLVNDRFFSSTVSLLPAAGV